MVGAAPAVHTAADRIALVADRGSLTPFDRDVEAVDPLRFVDRLPYRVRIEEARRRTRVGESVVTGRCRVSGREVVVVASEFEFLGGSIGVATAERIARAFERAAERGVPVLALVASGGSRMQEGALALVQMAKLAVAAGRFRRGGGLYVTYLMHPTTGGALASWASLGSVQLAEPGALVAFAGPRVAAALGDGAPQTGQRAEALHASGYLDALVEPAALRSCVSELLAVLAPTGRTMAPSRPGSRPRPRAARWTAQPPIRGTPCCASVRLRA
jgi:acyl-CoA carboxylase subunit beta